jgi:hypothetical protein
VRSVSSRIAPTADSSFDSNVLLLSSRFSRVAHTSMPSRWNERSSIWASTDSRARRDCSTMMILVKAFVFAAAASCWSPGRRSSLMAPVMPSSTKTGRSVQPRDAM